jgi:thiosulfate reductase cytochrome b subunit
MADSVFVPTSISVTREAQAPPRHSALVRITHWITTICFLALLLSGVEIVISHPRFYWGETGNVNMPPLFIIPIAASRATVPTGYGYVMPDQNGWSRYLHFQSAWALVITGGLYVLFGLLSRHFQKNLIPANLSAAALTRSFSNHLRFKPGAEAGAGYNPIQRLTYLAVIFVAFPLVIWTGLAMSPGFVSAFPFVVTILGGQQSARTIHFFVSLLLVAFLVVHVAMICVAGFSTSMRGMITGRTAKERDQQ